MYTPEFKAPRVLSVSQLTFYIKSLIENDARLNLVFVSGEISNLTNHYKSGHIYLSIKDERSVIRAVMFSGNARNLKFKPADGMKIICRGRIAVYEANGQYQLYIEDMQPDGIGALTLAYEQLKKSLEQKGLFDKAHKKPIPEFPETIGIITSPTGAAVQDIRNILSRRYPCINIVMCPVLVQGDNAPSQLVNAIKRLDKYKACDVIIIGRGGGSIEDLWAFNSEELAYAIYNCKIPVISAVGHETDFTICDFVSDLRAPTPSAAAELAVPDKNELIKSYTSQKQYLSSMIDLKLRKKYNSVNELNMRLNIASPQSKISDFERSLDKAKDLIKHHMSDIISNKSSKLANAATRLEGLNPVSILSRGYAIAEKDGKIISSSSMIKKDDLFTVKLSDGEIKAIATGE